MTTPKDSRFEDTKEWRLHPEQDEDISETPDESQSINNWNLSSLHDFNYGMFWGVVVGTIAIASASFGAALSTIPGVNSMIATKLDQNGLSQHHAQVKPIVAKSLTKPIDVLVVSSQSNGQKSNYRSQLEDNSGSISLWQFQPQQKLVKITLIAADSQIFIPALGWSTLRDAQNYGGISLVSQTISQIVDGVTVDRYISATPEAVAALTAATGNLRPDQCSSLNNNRLPYAKAVGKCTTKLSKFQQQEVAIATLRQKLNSQEISSQLYEAFPKIFQHLDTNLSRLEMLALTDFVSKIPEDQLQVSLPSDYLPKQQELVSNNRLDSVELKYQSPETITDITNPSSLSAIPNHHPFHNTPIAIQNTSNSPELAAKAIAYLRRRNFNNVYLVNYLPLKLTKTEIILPQTKIKTANYLRQTLGLGRLRLANDNSQEAIVIRIGEDAKYLTIEDSFIH